MARSTLIRDHDLIIVLASLWGRRRTGVIRLALDTAATETLIRPHVLHDFGYDERDVGPPTSITSAIGREPGYLVKVERLRTLGFEVTDHPIHAHALPAEYDIDGLLGLRYLDQFDYTIHSRRDQITVELAAP